MSERQIFSLGDYSDFTIILGGEESDVNNKNTRSNTNEKDIAESYVNNKKRKCEDDDELNESLKSPKKACIDKAEDIPKEIETLQEKEEQEQKARGDRGAPSSLTEFRVHKFNLSCWSSYFDSLFTSDPQNNVLRIPHTLGRRQYVSPEIFKTFLNVLYNKETKVTQMDDLICLLDLAHYFSCNQCEKLIIDHICSRQLKCTTEQYFEMFEIGINYRSDKLCDHALSILCQDNGKILKQELKVKPRLVYPFVSYMHPKFCPDESKKKMREQQQQYRAMISSIDDERAGELIQAQCRD